LIRHFFMYVMKYWQIIEREELIRHLFMSTG